MKPSIMSVVCFFFAVFFLKMQLSVKCHFVVHPTYFTTEQILTLVGPALKSNSPLMKWNETPNGSTPASVSLPIDRCLIELGGFSIAKFIYWREIHVYQINTYCNIYIYTHTESQYIYTHNNDVYYTHHMYRIHDKMYTAQLQIKAGCFCLLLSSRRRQDLRPSLPGELGVPKKYW